MVSGFFDRAEKIFEQLADEPEHKEQALLQLVTIYQQTREWSKAIKCGDALVAMGHKKMRKDIAHYWCELAMHELSLTNTSKGVLYFKRALTEDPKCVRATIALGNIYLESDNYTQTITMLEKVLEQDIDYISEISTNPSRLLLPDRARRRYVGVFKEMYCEESRCIG